MLDLNRCEIMESRIANISASLVDLEEGTAMSWILESGKGVLGKTGGASTDRFAGFAQTKFRRPTLGRMVESLVVSSGSIVTLARTPYGSASNRGVFNAAGTALTSVADVPSVDANTKYNLTGKVVTVHSDLNATTIKVQYQYELTASEAALLYGNDIMTFDTASVKGVGLITTGTVFIDSYDPAINFAGTAGVSGVLKCGAAGAITIGGSGATINGVVVSVPAAGDPFLGIDFHV